MRRTGSMGMIVRIMEGRYEQLTRRQVVEGPFLDQLRVELAEALSKGNDALAIDDHSSEALPLRWVRRSAEGGAALEGRDGTHKDADVAVRVLRVRRLHLTAVPHPRARRVRPSGGEARTVQTTAGRSVPRLSPAAPHGAPSPPPYLYASLIVATVRTFQFPVAAHRAPPRNLHMHVHSALVA